jgi:hypothetical protein
MSKGFAVPEVDAKNLLHSQQIANTIPLNAPVLCINRGRKTLLDTFNANHIEIPPGHFITEYEAAQHFRERLIVPGTKNLEVGGFVSWIGILGTTDGRIAVDAEALCQPFTDEELQAFGEKVEAIDRNAFSDPRARNVAVVRTSAAHAASAQHGIRPQIDASAQVSEQAREAAEHVFEPPTENLARQDAQEAAAEGHGHAAAVRATRRR